VCPVDGCITMLEQPREHAPLTWSELTEKIGSPGVCASTSSLTWEEFPEAVEGLVHSHGLGEAKSTPRLTGGVTRRG
jgi:hypothetical protein